MIKYPLKKTKLYLALSFLSFSLNPLAASNIERTSDSLQYKTYKKPYHNEIVHILRMGDAPWIERSEIYGAVAHYPQVPMLHPYHPGSIATPFAMSFSPSYKAALPEAIRSELARENIEDSHLKILSYAQDFPGYGDKPICLRPHYGIELDAPMSGLKEYRNKSIKAGIFNIGNNQISLDGPHGTCREYTISTHPNAGGGTVVSPDNLHIKGLNPETGDTFWSYVGYTDGVTKQKHVIVTLHWVLSNQIPDEYFYEYFYLSSYGQVLTRILSDFSMSRPDNFNQEFLDLIASKNQDFLFWQI